MGSTQSRLSRGAKDPDYLQIIYKLPDKGCMLLSGKHFFISMLPVSSSSGVAI
jgi:hypothetical protein